MLPRVIPEPWKSLLLEIDNAIKESTELHCLGGFVATILYGLERPTSDVDFIEITPRSEATHLLELAGEGSKLHRKHGVYLQLVGVAKVPEDYEQRLIEMFPGVFNLLRLLALDPYDIALSKLERNSQRDRDDIKHLARTVPFDLDVLKERYTKELRSNLGIPKREDLTLELWIDAIKEERSAAA
jgi:hypothetical protein